MFVDLLYLLIWDGVGSWLVCWVTRLGIEWNGLHHILSSRGIRLCVWYKPIKLFTHIWSDLEGAISGFSDQVTIPLSYHNFRSCYPICPPFLSQSLSNFYWILSNFYPIFHHCEIPWDPSVTRLWIVVDFPGKNHGFSMGVWNPGATRPLLRPKSPAFSCAVCGVSWSLWRRSWHARRPRRAWWRI